MKIAETMDVSKKYTMHLETRNQTIFSKKDYCFHVRMKLNI